LKLPTWTGSQAFVTRVAPGGKETKYRLALGLEEKRALCRSFVDLDFLTIQPEEWPRLPDEARPRITLTNRQHESHTVAKWAGVADERFDALYELLLALAERTAGQSPIKPRLATWQKGLFLAGVALVVLLSLLPAIWGARRLVSAWWPGRVGWLLGLLLLLLLAVVGGVRLLARREQHKMRWDRVFGNPALNGVINTLFFCATVGLVGMVEALVGAWRAGPAAAALDGERGFYAVFAYSAALAIPVLLLVAALIGKRVLRLVDERF
jgi:cytochrome c biogenesis protein CcdA